MTISRVATARTLLLLVVLSFPLTAAGHPEGFSGMQVTIAADRTRVAITLHTRDLGAWFPPGQYPDYVADVCREMEATIDEIVELQMNDQTLPIGSVKAFLLEVGLIEIDIDYQLPRSAETVELLIWSKLLIRMPRGHQQLLFVEDRRSITSNDQQGTMRLEEVLTVQRDAGAVLLPPLDIRSPDPATDTTKPTPDSSTLKDPPTSAQQLERKPNAAAATALPSSRISFFMFGVEHIVTGYDHLLFLAALLLTCTRFREAAAIITCFTVAHSITLALAALDIVRLPTWIVEPAIAFSIVYVAIENLTGQPGIWRRAGITCFFGLIHGLGFASALRDIGLGTIPGGVLWPLLKFNLGVEFGQLCVASILLPLLILARRSERLAKRLVPVGSLLVAAIGGYWLLTRILSQFGTWSESL